MSKCWCGEELEKERRCEHCDTPESRCAVYQGQHWVLRDSADPNTGEPCGAMVAYTVCPVHGENWRLSQETVAALVEAVEAADRALCGLAGYAATHPVMAWLSEANAKIIDALALLPESTDEAP